MRLAQTRYDNRETGCCARLNERDWNEREMVFTNRPFVRDHVHAIMHLPLDFGAVMKREHGAVEAAEAYPEEPFWLVDEVSPWGSEVYLATDREVPDAKMEHLSGTFLTKMFEGPYRDIGKWIKQTNDYVSSRGKAVEKLYFYYAQCPKCAKKLGKNQVVVFAKTA